MTGRNENSFLLGLLDVYLFETTMDLPNGELK